MGSALSILGQLLRQWTGPTSSRLRAELLRVAVLSCAGMWLLGGCASTSQPIPSHHYALGEILSSPATNDAKVAGSNGKVLGLAPIAAPPWLAGTGMFYRLARDEDNRLSAYAYSDWVAPPAALLEPVVQNALASASGWQAVVGPGMAATVDVSLHLRLENFSQVFTRPKQSMGVIEMIATLIGNPGGHVLAQKRFRVQVAAPTADAEGGARALGAASRQLAAQLQRWVRQVAKTNR